MRKRYLTRVRYRLECPQQLWITQFAAKSRVGFGWLRVVSGQWNLKLALTIVAQNLYFSPYIKIFNFCIQAFKISQDFLACKLLCFSLQYFLSAMFFFFFKEVPLALIKPVLFLPFISKFSPTKWKNLIFSCSFRCYLSFSFDNWGKFLTSAM